MEFASKRGYHYRLGFKINNQAIPDPSAFSGKESDLDASAGRSANGLLHRQRVARKHPMKLEYKNIEWQMMQYILSLMEGESFTFVCPSPCTVGGSLEITAYCGDRDWDATFVDEEGTYYGDLKFSVIEY